MAMEANGLIPFILSELVNLILMEGLDPNIIRKIEEMEET